MTEEITDSSWPMSKVTMLVEVHALPGLFIDWYKTMPWPFTPFHTIFIQPHVFCEENYRLLSILLVERDLPTVCFCLSDHEKYQLIAPSIYMLPPTLPSPLMYPQHGSPYLLQLINRRNVDLELNNDFVDEILSIAADTDSVPPSPTMVPDELSGDEMDFSENESEGEDEEDETEHEFEESADEE